MIIKNRLRKLALVGLLLLLVTLPFLLNRSQAHPAIDLIIASGGSISASVVENDLTSRYFAPANFVTTLQVDVDYQTRSWSVTADVDFISGPAPAPASALEVRTSQTVNFINAATPMIIYSGTGDATFNVDYRLDLAQLANGASSLVTPYVFNIVYTATDDGGASDQETATVTVYATEAVRIAVTGNPSNAFVTRSSLMSRYFAIPGTANFSINAITNYAITATGSLLLNGNPASLNGILEVASVSATSNVGGAITLGTFPADVPESAPGLFLYRETFGTLNNAGNATTAAVSFRMDLDAIGNAGSGWTYTFTVTFTVTEE